MTDAFTNADPLFQRAKNLGTRRLPLTRSRDPVWPVVSVFLAGSVLVAIAVAFVIGVFSL